MNWILLLLLFAVLIYTIKATRTTAPNDRQPSPVDRVAAWERKMGEWRAEQRLRQYRAQIAFDERASVQPKITPRLPN